MKQDKSGDITRRRFLGAAAFGLAAAGWPTLTTGSDRTGPEKKAGTAPEQEVITRTLGRTGIEIPVISMGVMNANNPQVVKASYDLGIRHFDTAAYYQYGRNEQMVGNIINKAGVRDKVIIATKVFAAGQRRGLDEEEAVEKLIHIFEGSLQRLGMDYVDILYIHDVSNAETVNDPAVITALKKLKKAKKVRFTGVSTHSNMAEVINAAVEGGFFDVVLTSINYTMADDTELLGSIEKAAQNGVGVIAMKTMAGGLRGLAPEIQAKYKSATIAGASLKWVLRNENITTAIPGFDNFEHMEEDFRVATDLEYTDQEKAFLADKEIQLGIDFCRQCRRCLASCPAGVEIPALMRTYMYAVQYGNFYQARATLDGIAANAGLDACRSCPDCRASCARTVDIASRIEELKLIYV